MRSLYKLLPDRFPTIVRFWVLFLPPGVFVFWIVMTNWVHWSRCCCVSLSFPATLNLTSPMLAIEFLAHKIPFSLLKMHSSCAWTSFWSQPCYYNSLLYFFILFLEEMDTIFPWDTCFSFPLLPLLYPTTVPSSVNSLFSVKLIWSTFKYPLQTAQRALVILLTVLLLLFFITRN